MAMARALVRVFDAILVLSAVMSMTMPSAHAQLSPLLCPTGVANFGDSLTDTGNAADAFPFVLAADFPPYGETFFGKPAKRFSNGRLVPDFFSLAFGWPLLDAYFSVASFNYKFGVNFANAGADAAFTTTALEPFALTPLQTSQFIRFQNSTFATQAQGLGCANFNLQLPLLNPFAKWLYTITAGSNDLLTPLTNGAPISFVNATIVPQAVGAVIEAIKVLYGTGARRFLVYGIPAGGCLPAALTRQENQTPPPQKDNLGCIVALNSVVQNFNTQLLSLITDLRRSLSGVSIAFFDYYSANIAILSDPTAFGFDSNKTKTACCGAPGTFNYNPNITCGAQGSNNCVDPDKYVNWDGVHFTENFYRQIAIFALNGNYTNGGINYNQSCVLDSSKFPSGVTFQQAYPSQKCNNLYT